VVTTEEVALALGAVALFVSVVSLWLSSLTSFKLQMFHTPPGFRLYKITPEISGDKDGTTWWIPSFDVGFSFQNLGKRSGVVYDVRVVMRFPRTPRVQTDALYPKWIVDYPEYQGQAHKRFEWIETAVKGEWYPVLLVEGEAKQLHLVLESRRWDEKRVGMALVTVQVRSSKRQDWTTCCNMQILVTEDLYETGSSITPADPHLDAYRGESTLPQPKEVE
jgi:hypothetical protein